jgi:hypothetical protein
LSQDPHDVDPQLAITKLVEPIFVPRGPTIDSTSHGTIVKPAYKHDDYDGVLLLFCCAALVAAASVAIGGSIGPVEVRCTTVLPPAMYGSNDKHWPVKLIDAVLEEYAPAENAKIRIVLKGT